MKLFITATLTLISAGAMAQGAPGPKAGQTEFGFSIVHSFSDSFVGREGSTLDLSSRTGFQVGVDYFVNNKLSAGFDATWLRPQFDAVLVPEDGSPNVSISNRSSIFSGQFNGTYNFIEGSFTPYIEAGLGWTYFDSNVADDAPVTGCWWDPWWGYICSDFYSTYSSTNFSYGAGIGIRWDMNRDIAIKAGYRLLEVESDGLREKPQLESALIEVVYKY